METRYFKIDRDRPELDLIAEAAQLLKKGQIVAFPTETVYGLGADALQVGAVEKIFLAKGRPSENPLLIHISKREQVESLASEVPPLAQKLMDRFWPGPLSIILPAQPRVPEVVRAGKPGVGLRMPSHPVALALIDASGPLAAPSANLYGRPSPTSAWHVRQDLDGRIAAVLDAGETGGGMESTIIDLSQSTIKIIRRGSISVEEIQKVTGEIAEIDIKAAIIPYKLRVQVIISEDWADYQYKIENYCSRGRSWAAINIGQHQILEERGDSDEYRLDLQGEGESFYSILRDAEEKGIEILLFPPLDKDLGGVAQAMLDRIERAAVSKPDRGTRAVDV